MLGVENYKWHPQPSSIPISTKALKIADVSDSIVLDPFCGTGTLLIAAVLNKARKAIGSDIEDWSFCVRPQIKNWILSGSNKIELYWNVDAMFAIKHFKHDTLVTNPPHPFRIGCAKTYSAKRDTGMHVGQLEKYWRHKLNKNNLMGKGTKTIAYVLRLVKIELEEGKRVIINLFRDSKGFNYQKYFDKYFIIKHLYGYFFEVVRCRR